MGRSGHEGRDDVRGRERAVEQPPDRAFSTASAATAGALSSSAGFYRRSLDARNWPQIYPLGFLPLIEPTVVDVSGAGGVRGVFNRWNYDASAGFGRNTFAFEVGNSLNVSLGPSVGPDKTRFDAGTLELGQFVGNVDVSRAFRVGGLAGPLNVAMGAEFRHENYVIRAGEPDSYGDGGVPNQFGGRAAIGAQVFPGFRPSNEVDRIAAQRRRLRGRRGGPGQLAACRCRRRERRITATSAGRWMASSPFACSRIGGSCCAGRSARDSARRRSASRSSPRRPPTFSISVKASCPWSR